MRHIHTIGDRVPPAPEIGMTHTDVYATPDLNCTAVVHPDGRYEIRENDNADGWIRTDSPVPVEL
jgi:hypothetical protein